MTPEAKTAPSATDTVLTAMLDGRWRTITDVMRKARMHEETVRPALIELTRLGVLVAENLPHKARIWRLASVDENGRTRRTA